MVSAFIIDFTHHSGLSEVYHEMCYALIDDFYWDGENGQGNPIILWAAEFKRQDVQYEAYQGILSATKEKVHWAYDVWDQLVIG